MSEQTGPDLVAQIDQFGAALGGFADALVTFRNRLIDGGISGETSEEMTRQLAEQWSRGTFNKASINLPGLGG